MVSRMVHSNYNGMSRSKFFCWAEMLSGETCLHVMTIVVTATLKHHLQKVEMTLKIRVFWDSLLGLLDIEGEGNALF